MAFSLNNWRIQKEMNSISLPGWLQGKHNVVIRSWSPACCLPVVMKPYQNRLFWCYSCHPVASFQVWGLGGYEKGRSWKGKKRHGWRISYREWRKEESPRNITCRVYGSVQMADSCMLCRKKKLTTYQIEWLWQKSSAEIICRKNRLASLGVSLPFLTK